MRPVRLTDAVLHLAPPRPEDVEDLLAACQDPDISRWTSVPHPYTRADAQTWVTDAGSRAWTDDRAYGWSVRDAREPAELLGSVGLHHLDLQRREAEIGYWTAREARGRGVTSAAVGLVCRWAFEELGLERINWEAGVGNDASRRVAEKCGFTLEATTRSGLLQHGARQDSWRAGLLAGDPRPAAQAFRSEPADAHASTTQAHHAAASPDEWLPRGVEVTAGSLHLRPWRTDDADALGAAVLDREIARWNPFDRNGTPAEDAQRFVDLADQPSTNRLAFAVVDATTGELLGSVALDDLDAAGASGRIDYWTLPAARGRGVASRAVGTAARFAFGALGLARLELVHAVENAASCRVADAAGFALEGTTRSSCRYGDGDRHDEHLHAALPTDL